MKPSELHDATGVRLWMHLLQCGLRRMQHTNLDAGGSPWELALFGVVSEPCRAGRFTQANDR